MAMFLGKKLKRQGAIGDLAVNNGEGKEDLNEYSGYMKVTSDILIMISSYLTFGDNIRSFIRISKSHHSLKIRKAIYGRITYVEGPIPSKRRDNKNSISYFYGYSYGYCYDNKYDSEFKTRCGSKITMDELVKFKNLRYIYVDMSYRYTGAPVDKKIEFMLGEVAKINLKRLDIFMDDEIFDIFDIRILEEIKKLNHLKLTCAQISNCVLDRENKEEKTIFDFSDNLKEITFDRCQFDYGEFNVEFKRKNTNITHITFTDTDFGDDIEIWVEKFKDTFINLESLIIDGIQKIE